MPRPRRTTPNQRSQNVGANRNIQMRNNTRAGRQMPFSQQPPGAGVGAGAGGGKNVLGCPAGQKPGRGADGKPTCVPDTNAGGANLPGGQPGAQAQQVGAGIPTGIVPPKNRQGY